MNCEFALPQLESPPDARDYIQVGSNLVGMDENNEIMIHLYQFDADSTITNHYIIPHLLDVVNQGIYGSCAAQVGAVVHEAAIARAQHVSVADDASSNAVATHGDHHTAVHVAHKSNNVTIDRRSVSFLYNYRVLWYKDVGMFIRNLCKYVTQMECPIEPDYPYTRFNLIYYPYISKLIRTIVPTTLFPTLVGTSTGLVRYFHKINTHSFGGDEDSSFIIQNKNMIVENMKLGIANSSLPLIIGVYIYNLRQVEYKIWKKTGDDGAIGGHAMAVVGWHDEEVDEKDVAPIDQNIELLPPTAAKSLPEPSSTKVTQGYFIIRNSWGVWGNLDKDGNAKEGGGYCKFPYEDVFDIFECYGFCV
jgi:hypothetical protein